MTTGCPLFLLITVVAGIVQEKTETLDFMSSVLCTSDTASSSLFRERLICVNEIRALWAFILFFQAKSCEKAVYILLSVGTVKN